MSSRKRPDFTNSLVHVVNRGVQRRQLFRNDDDYAAFEVLLIETLRLIPLRLLAFCLMPNHWHLLVWPSGPDELPRCMHRLTLTHAKRLHAFLGTNGHGHVYQGPYRASLVQPGEDDFFRVMRYVERNALRAGLVDTAVEWRWGSLWHREHDDPRGLLCEPPIALPANWPAHVEAPLRQSELEALRRATKRGAPIGDPAWVAAAAQRFGLERTLRPRGRPPKPK